MFLPAGAYKMVGSRVHLTYVITEADNKRFELCHWDLKSTGVLSYVSYTDSLQTSNLVQFSSFVYTI